MSAAQLPKGVVVHDSWKDEGRKGVAMRWVWKAYDSVRRKYTNKSFSDYDAGLEWAKLKLAELQVGVATASSAKVRDLGDDYIKEISGQVSDKHRDLCKAIIEEAIEKGMTDMRADTFGSRVKAWILELKAQRTNQKVATPAGKASKQRRMFVIRTLIKRALAQGLITRDPLATFKLRGRDTKITADVFTVDEARKLMADESRDRPGHLRREVEAAVAKHKGDKRAAAKALGVHLATIYNRLEGPTQERDPWWSFACLAGYTGMRPSEARDARWSWVDWNNGDIVVPPTAKGNKMKCERRIPIEPELLALLKSWRIVGDAPILPKEVHEASESTTSKAFRRYCDRCDVRARKPHLLRHFRGAILTAMGTQSVLVLIALGHDDPKQGKHYAETAGAFKHAVAGWSGRVYLRDAQPKGKKPLQLPGKAHR